MTRQRTVARAGRLGRPPLSDSGETRDRLVLHARLAFASLGYDATTNKVIAANAGLTPAAIYHYFPSKAELYLAVYQELQDVVFHEFERVTASASSFLDRVGALLDAAVELNRRDPSLAAFVIGVASEAQRHPDVAELVAPVGSRTAAMLRSLVADARAAGELTADVDDRGLEDLLNAILSGLARFSHFTGSVERHGAAAEVLKQLLAGAVLTPSRTG
jgi:AcrR family transcriptional regulator